MTLFYNLGQPARIVQGRTWTEHIVVPWLVVMVSHEQRRLIRFQQSFFPDIRIRIVDKRAGLNVSVGVDMAVAAPAGNASAHILSVIPEIHRKNRLCPAILPDPVVHHLTLFCRRHQLLHRAFSHRHVSKEPGKFRAHADHLVKIFFASDNFGICGSIAAGNAKGQLSFF